MSFQDIINLKITKEICYFPWHLIFNSLCICYPEQHISNWASQSSKSNSCMWLVATVLDSTFSINRLFELHTFHMLMFMLAIFVIIYIHICISRCSKLLRSLMYRHGWVSIYLIKNSLFPKDIHHRFPSQSDSFWIVSNDLIYRNVIFKQLKSNASTM
jgi:hypothetical protein